MLVITKFFIATYPGCLLLPRLSLGVEMSIMLTSSVEFIAIAAGKRRFLSTFKYVGSAAVELCARVECGVTRSLDYSVALV